MPISQICGSGFGSRRLSSSTPGGSRGLRTEHEDYIHLHPKSDTIKFCVVNVLTRRHLQWIAPVLVAMSIVAFMPRIQRPHIRLSSVSIQNTTLGGAQRFTDDSSRLPDLKAAYEANGVPLPQDPKIVPEDQALTPLLTIRFVFPSIRPIIRRSKLLPSRTENQDPL